MTDSSLVKSVRMPAALWAYVLERAQKREITPNAWLTRMVRLAAEGRLVEAKETPTAAPASAPGQSKAGSRLKGEWKAP